MDARTAAALEKSIQHWEKNAAAERPDDVCLGPSDCALCALFWGDECDGCPVSQRTGQITCDDTPYYAALTAFNEWERAGGQDSVMKPVTQLRDTFREAARAEIAFLISLREPPTT